jgi:hypothetical protein
MVKKQHVVVAQDKEMTGIKAEAMVEISVMDASVEEDDRSVQRPSTKRRDPKS